MKKLSFKLTWNYQIKLNFHVIAMIKNYYDEQLLKAVPKKTNS